MRSDTDKECVDCTFDTNTIVSVSIDNWTYCPVCGGDLRPYGAEEQGTEIPIGAEEDVQTDERPDETETVETEQIPTESDAIERELEQLRDEYQDDD